MTSMIPTIRGVASAYRRQRHLRTSDGIAIDDSEMFQVAMIGAAQSILSFNADKGKSRSSWLVECARYALRELGKKVAREWARDATVLHRELMPSDICDCSVDSSGESLARVCQASDVVGIEADIVLMHFCGGMNFNEISRESGVRVKAAKMSLLQSLEKIKLHLELTGDSLV